MSNRGSIAEDACEINGKGRKIGVFCHPRPAVPVSLGHVILARHAKISSSHMLAIMERGGIRVSALPTTALALLLLYVPLAAGRLPEIAQKDSPAASLAPYVPTPQEVVDRMLELAQVGKGDVVYDL